MQASARVATRVAQDLTLSPRDKVAEYIGRIVDFALAAIVFIAPLFMGGRGPVGRLVLVSLIGIAAVAWFARQCLVENARWRWSGAELLLLLGAMLVVLQLTPLPMGLRNQLSPAIGKLLPLWSGSMDAPVQLGNWSTISLTPEDTRGGLVMFLAYAMLFLVVVQRIGEVADVARILRWIAYAALGMAVIGVGQFLFGNGKFLWVYEHPMRSTIDSVKGTFQNQNHFAHFLALGLGPLVYCLCQLGNHRSTRSADRKESKNSWGKSRNVFDNLGRNSQSTFVRQILMVGISGVIVAALLTYSRGGMLAMTVTLISCFAIFGWKSLIDRTTGWILASAAVVIGAAIFIFGHDTVAHELSTLWNAESLQGLSRGRAYLWQALIEAIPHFAMMGSGIGSHREVYPIYMEEFFEFEFTHGESGYLPLLLEAGIPGTVLMVAGILLSHYWCVHSLRSPADSSREGSHGENSRAIIACAGAIWPGLICSVVHSIGDFVWYIPACMSITVIMVACACRLSQLKNEASQSSSSRAEKSTSRARSQQASWRWGTRALVACSVCICGIALVQNRLGPARAAAHWDEYLKLSRAMKQNPLAEFAEQRERLVAMDEQLERVTYFDPHNARANLARASVCIKRFELEQRLGENPMPLSQIRDAAFASAFASKQAQDEWLSRAIGQNRRMLDVALSNCRIALSLCPLQGVAYLHMADLAFLESPRDTAKNAYIQQAAIVRPYSGRVLYAVGNDAALAGDHTKALQYWKRAFHQDPDVQLQIIEMLAEGLPPKIFISTFNPNTVGLWRLYGHLQTHNRVSEAQEVGGVLAATLIREAANLPPAKAAANLHQAQGVYLYVGDIERAVSCESKAVELTPNDYERRRVLGSLLVRTHRYADATPHLEWCLRRHPEDGDLRQELNDAKDHVGDRQASLPKE